MTSAPASPAVEELKQAAERAEAAAAKAEKAAARPTYLLIAGFSFALVGAVLAFALRDGDPSVLGVKLQPFGGILFGFGLLLIVCAAIGSMGNGNGGSSTSVKSIGGLIAVGLGITAVTALAIVTLTRFDGTEKDSIVAITTSAFGIISAVVGAYLGIKITADTTGKATEQAEDAAVAQHEAAVKEKKIATVNETMEKLVSEGKLDQAQADAIGDASVTAEEVARTSGPHHGGVSA
jgi:hypothetical protein